MVDVALPAVRSRSFDRRSAGSLVLMAASGFAGLGYQIVWTQQGASWLGHESAAVLAVVAAFFAGLAFGALALGRRIEQSVRPVRWYVACEGVIAAWSLVLLFGMAPFGEAMLALTGVQPTAVWQWTVAFVGMFVVLLPATAAMGATLPAVERVVSGPFEGRTLAALYAANTVGATAGVLGAAFWLVPSIGLSGTAAVCVALNALCAAGAWALFGQDRVETKASVASSTDASIRRRLSFLLAATGLLGIGYEVLVIRVLSQVCEDTVYTFAMLLAVYLLGSAAGAAVQHRRAARTDGHDAAAATDRLLAALATACVVGASCLWFADVARDAVVEALGTSLASAMSAEAALAVVAFAGPTCVMGALFAQLCTRAHRAGVPFGRSVGLNVVGAACAPIVFGVLLAPAVGAKFGFLAIVAGYLALVTRRAWTRPLAWVAAVATAFIGLGAPPLTFVDLPDGGRVVSYREGVLAAVSVVEDADGVSRLRIDNRQQEGSGATRLVDARQALLPLLLHPAPRRALFLGLGTGVTASSAAEQVGLEVDAVELLPEVIAASSSFTADFAGRERLHPIQADARRFVRTTATRYDVIVADNFHPARSGSGSLYTVEHFAAIRDRLADDGLFCQWLPLHQLDLDTLRSIVRSFDAVFPHGWALLASNSLVTPVVGLVGNRDGRRFDGAVIRARLADSGLPRHPDAFGIDDAYALFGSFVAGPAALQRFAGDAPLNTDDHPIVAYRAPRATYAPEALPGERLAALMEALSIMPSDVLVGSDDVEAVRVAAYWQARDRYLVLGGHVRLSSDVGQMLAQLRDPLLAVLAISPDFRPAYDPLLRMARESSRDDRDGARTLLQALIRVQPARSEARDALAAIDVSRD